MANNINILLISVVVVGALAWTNQDKLKEQWQKMRPTSAPVASQTTVYTWKDKDGTIHYSNTPDSQKASTTMVDTGKISRLEPLPQSKQTTKQEDKLLLEKVREDMIKTRDKMQEAREKQMMQQIER